ncbi:hypothetical protein [Nitrosospira sp. Nsp1]|uniref:hypothetical protein n=1 Tax=Nitrosospira sp. Nsp1 TaxID=136547 RepID=UPI00087E18AF|nr:hypothetical protein [Nitrosospira sp. Nsp1]SCX40432.1 hypothetical protein SAMN05720354_103108 [Nitrosospira sp. Nsp1]
MDIVISLIVRIVLPLLVVLVLCVWSYSTGVSHESNKRDAHELILREKADDAYDAAAQAARNHAIASIEWKRKAESFYRKWQEKLNNVDDTRLSECITPGTPAKDENPAPAGCLLSPAWVGLYNDAWHPDGLPADSGGAAAISGGTAAATPREALVNVRANAGLCADDRQRQRELIDYLHELEAGRARPTD